MAVAFEVSCLGFLWFSFVGGVRWRWVKGKKRFGLGECAGKGGLV